MEGVVSEARTRVNGALLAQYNSRPVVLMGEVDKVDPSGRMVTVRASDGQPVQVRFQQPLQEILEGVVEIHGVAEGRQLVCKSYITFPLDDAKNFDMQAYDQAIRLIHSVKDNPWKFE
ncbi:replication protein A 14 kDa subunit [Procambarus clarkii]|uniref:replication protein A 14 kDa subunit n=1 Tax=Procambarus clarkii TaxID=6728 RepID=UPI001E67884F|nr:replication protein A 14 kDa subunit-like [Procambarus clarkii]